jgi:stage V sporulation protein D (sporulation-specific penicillin-binding protein)
MLGFAMLAAKLFAIQVVEHGRYSGEAEKIQGRRWPIQAPRGNIYDRNGNPLALNLKLFSVAADPGLVDRPAEVAGKLQPLLRMGQGELRERLTAKEGVRYVRLQEGVDRPIASAIRKLDYPGIIVDTEWKRAYPQQHVAASLLGFVGQDRNALGGIERALDKRLAGQDGEMLVVLDGRLPRSRAQIPERSVVAKQMVPGSSVVLTIDLDIQAIAEEELAKAVESARAVGGAAVVMDPKTGEVLALASQPGFDPNEFQRYPQKSWVSHVIVSPYEPGSTFKIITACAAIEEGVMSHGETYTCTGTRAVGRRTIGCARHAGSRAHGTLDLDGIVVHSCNVGAATVAMKLGAGRMYKWVKKFGFGEKTGIEVSGESRGILAPASKWSQMQLANMGFGQGIGVTPLQLLSAYAAVANGGYRVRPRVVKAITAPTGEMEYPPLPQPERILSEATSERMRGIMRRVVEEGTGKAARIPGRSVAGKTGTAQKPTPEAGFKSGKYIGSFAGFAPAEDPRIAVIVVVDEPRNGYYGAVVAAPAFKAICERALTYLRVPPDAPGPRVTVAKAESDD